jgi:hypothetical protein
MKSILPRWRPAGFRMSLSDLIALLISMALAGGVWPFARDLSVVVLTVIFHFFLFCNVFRIRRGPELIWAVIYLVNCSAWHFAGSFSGWRALLAQLPVTAMLILNELRHPAYHGIFSRGARNGGTRRPE